MRLLLCALFAGLVLFLPLKVRACDYGYGAVRVQTIYAQPIVQPVYVQQFAVQKVPVFVQQQSVYGSLGVQRIRSFNLSVGVQRSSIIRERSSFRSGGFFRSRSVERSRFFQR